MNTRSDFQIQKKRFRTSLPATLAALALIFLAHAASAQPCDPPPAGIVSWWSGESNAFDNFGINNGVLVGSPTFTNGEVGLAFDFNGGQFVRVSNSSSLQNLSTITVEAWVHPASYNPGSASSILVKFDAQVDVNQSSWSFGIDGNGPGFFGVSTNGANGSFTYTANLCPLNAWTHLAATYDGNNIVIYFNGVAQGSVPLAGSIFAGTDDVAIGANIGGVGNGQATALFKGLIDEPTIYNRALSAGEIQAIYNAGSAGKCPDILPTIITPPANQSVYAGQWTSFTITAAGSQPLTYQWQLNGTNIAGADGPSLALPYVQLNQAGTYTIIVSNAAAAGNPATASANLAVLTPPPCDPAPANIASWWAGEGNALDNLGLNNGVLAGTAGYAPGIVGQAFNFLAAGDGVSTPTAGLPTGTSDRTMECWVYINLFIPGAETAFAGYGNFGTEGAIYYFGADVNQNFFFSQWGQSFTGPVLTTNQWYHVAVTSVGTNLITLYLDGTNVATGSLPFNTPAGTTLYMGEVNAPFTQRQLIGEIDELSIYSRALSATEIQAIYNAAAGGKCSFAPSIVAQPTNQSILIGNSVTLAAAVSGSQPMTCQWEFDGSPIPGATNLSLTIFNAQPTNSGNYSLRATNSVNSAASSNATLNVILVSTYGNGLPLINSQYIFTNSVTIKLTNATGGDIFYTTNGTIPTAGSTLYTGQFVITNSSVIQALGYSPNFQESALSPPVSIVIPPVYTLSVTTAGGGNISLSPTNTSDINNTLVTLTATPSNGWIFLQWLGDAAGTNISNSVILDRNKSVQAVFGTTVSTTFGGNGSVVLNPAGGVYPFGTILQASAVPQSGNFFVLWGDSASGNVNPLAFAVTNTNSTISALFTTLGVSEAALAVVPVGHGTVSINPPANSYANGTSVTITATAATNHAFLGWSGGASGTNNPLTLQLNQSETIFANFTTNHSLLLYPVTPPGIADGVAVDLLGELGTHYRLDASTNLSNWTTLYNLTNEVGTIHFIDTNAPGLNSRFYRDTILP